MKRNRKKESLILSVMSLLLCVSMLAGSTYAWFTDEVSSGVNQIVAGNLDVELEHKVGADYESVEGQTGLFKNAVGNTILWEPGAMAAETFRISNVGSLALKYKLSLNDAGHNFVNGTDKSLLDVIKVAIVDDPLESTREDIITQVGTNWVTLGDLVDNVYDEDILYPASAGTSTKEFSIVLYWEPNDNAVDNLYNLKNGAYASDSTQEEVGSLFANFGITLVATQQPYEADSFDNQYDLNATYPANPSQGTRTAADSATVATSGTASFVVATTPESNPTAGTVNTNVEITGLTAGDELDLSVSTQGLATASTNSDFVVENDHTAVAGIDLTLTKNGTEVTFDSGVATIVTYIVPGLDPAKVTVKYNGTGTAPTLVSYDSTTGRLEFTTTHFSEYFVDYDGEFIYLPANGKAYVLPTNAYDVDLEIAAYATLKAEIEEVIDVDKLMTYIHTCLDFFDEEPLDWTKEETLHYVLIQNGQANPYTELVDYLQTGKTMDDVKELAKDYKEFLNSGVVYPQGGNFVVGGGASVSFGWPSPEGNDF